MSVMTAPSISCPVPHDDASRIQLAHGGGGRLMRDLIDRVFVPAFRNPTLERLHDSSVVTVGGVRIAMTTDSFVVHPLFFPGGDIGSLAVHGTVNDLAMSGATPLFLSVAFIIEAGFDMKTLERITRSLADAARACGVQVITGDTKVVDTGKGDGLFINTAGMGIVTHPTPIAPTSIRAGDVILISGDVGRHGMAVMSVREGLQFVGDITSDSAPVSGIVADLLRAGVEVHCLRDLTRGGLAAALNELATASGTAIQISESAVPVGEAVRGACEILGLDPLYVACEGRMIAFVPECQASQAMSVIKQSENGREAAVIGKVLPVDSTLHRAGDVTLISTIGAARILDLPATDPLPRIC